MWAATTCWIFSRSTRRRPSSGFRWRLAACDRGTDSVAEMVLRTVDDREPLSLYVFKTMADPFSGRISFFKIFSGVARSDATVTNYTHRSLERLAHLTVMQGRTASSISELHAGDLGAVAKLRETFTGDTLGDAGHEIYFDPVTMPEPAVTYAIEPKTRADEEKLAPAVHKLMEEDLMVRFYRDAATHEFLLAGSGQPHIESVVHRLHRRYHTDVTLKAPKVPYRETIRVGASAQGRHKKQSGGHGQYGDCWIRLEPLALGGGFEFVNEILRGSDSPHLYSRCGEGGSGGGCAGMAGRFSPGGFPGRSLRRQLSRCGFE